MGSQTNPVNRLICLAAGGTGGHVFPALHTADALKSRGFDVSMITDKRGAALLPPGRQRTIIAAASPFAGSLARRLIAVVKLSAGFVQTLTCLLRKRPLAVIGYGGYPSAAPTLAAWLLGIPVWLHEQNAVMGRANQLLSRLVHQVFISWPKTKGLPSASRHVHTGLPVASRFSALPAYADTQGREKLHIAVFGGSQGAYLFAEILPHAVARLPIGLKAGLRITQQARTEQTDALRASYAAQNIDADIRPFFDDVAGVMGSADLIISRSGASTVAELAAAGRPSVLIPFAHALDGHQLENARQLADINAAVLISEQGATADHLAKQITRLLSDPQCRLQQAQAARTIACPDAAMRICSLIETRLSGTQQEEEAA